jgi:hypothetical protein
VVAGTGRLGPAGVTLEIGGNEGQTIAGIGAALLQHRAHVGLARRLRTVVRTRCPTASSCTTGA